MPFQLNMSKSLNYICKVRAFEIAKKSICEFPDEERKEKLYLIYKWERERARIYKLTTWTIRKKKNLTEGPSLYYYIIIQPVNMLTVFVF